MDRERGEIAHMCTFAMHRSIERQQQPWNKQNREHNRDGKRR